MNPRVSEITGAVPSRTVAVRLIVPVAVVEALSWGVLPPITFAIKGSLDDHVTKLAGITLPFWS